MLNIIAIIVFILSITGMAIMAYRKAPAIALYIPQINSKPSLFSSVKDRLSLKKIIPNELFLQKFLSKVRILVLKTDNKTSEWMRRLREKSVQNKTKFADNYWEKLKK